MAHGYLGDGDGSHGDIDPDRDDDRERNWRGREDWRGRERDIFAFEWEGRRIWGATAAILKNLLDRLENSR